MANCTKKLFQIAEAARACGLSRSTLLRMEEKGLVTPAYTAPDSGRRYYDNHNVARVLQIEKFKAMGLGVEAIAAYFAHGGDTTELLAALEASPDTEYLAVHDGARPLILPEQVDEMIRLGQRTYAVAPALPVTDTVKVADMAGLVLSTPDRSTLFAVQTPQVFQANILKAALQSALAAGAALTDDCSAVERLGKEVYLTPGWRENIKITTPEDLSVAEAFLRRRGDAQ